MKKITITQSNYIPWKGYFDGINMVDEMVIFDDMQYTKRDWRNRNQIKTPNGLQWLSIPVEVKGKYFQKIKDTKVSDKNWPVDHWNIIRQNYNKSKYFSEYKDVFEPLYLNMNLEYLSEINFQFIKIICDLLKIKIEFKWSSEFELLDEKTERLVGICKQEKATDYYSGPAAKAYMNEELFRKNDISVHYFNYSDYPVYNQPYGEFSHSVSILDLLFNEGKDSKRFMKSFNNPK